MEKLKLLNKFLEQAGSLSLHLEAVRLYLLLLASSERTGRGEISVGTLGRVFGGDLRKACHALVSKRLIRIVSSAVVGEASSEGILVYHLFSGEPEPIITYHRQEGCQPCLPKYFPYFEDGGNVSIHQKTSSLEDR